MEKNTNFNLMDIVKVEKNENSEWINEMHEYNGEIGYIHSFLSELKKGEELKSGVNVCFVSKDSRNVATLFSFDKSELSLYNI